MPQKHLQQIILQREHSCLWDGEAMQSGIKFPKLQWNLLPPFSRKSMKSNVEKWRPYREEKFGIGDLCEPIGVRTAS